MKQLTTGYCFECGCHINGRHQEWCSIKRFGFITLTLLLLTGCVIGRLDSDHLRIIPITEVHRMDDKGFPLNVFQPKHERK